jgi:flagellar L-ring protein FlgH
MKIFLSLILVTLLSSCSSYINKMHKQLDRDIESEKLGERPRQNGKRTRRRNDNFDIYRNSGRKYVNNDRQAIVSSKNNRFMSPKTKRHYRPMEKAKKRFTADDLNDNQQTASLWSNNSNQLFYRDVQKRNGDIILINVFKSLKDEIILELKRAFPDSTNKSKKGNTPKSEAKPAEEKKTAAPPTAAGDSKAHDRISSVVIEEINQDHLLIRGRKSLLYKNAKRLVEIQALITRKDVSDEDTINSDSILETTVNVLR